MKGGFTHPHWAGFTDYTNPFGVAVGYVLIKQSGPPGHCDLFFPKENRHGFYRGYTTNLPSSLDRIILSHLRLLSVGTSVGSGYRHQAIFPIGFHGVRDSPKPSQGRPITPSPSSPHYETPRASVLGLRWAISNRTNRIRAWWYGNINPFPLENFG